MASQPVSPSDLHNLYILVDIAVTLLNQQHQQQKKVNQQSLQKKVKKNSKRKEKRPSSAARCREQQQQHRAPQGWLLELVAELGGMGPPAFLCAKRLTISDTNRNLNRFAVSRNIVYDVLFPLMEDDEQNEVYSTGGRVGGGGLRVQGHDGMGPLSLCFKFWESNLMFLFNDGWKLIVERNGLRPDKDVVELWCFRDASMAMHFAFCIVGGEEGGDFIRGEEKGGSKKEENGAADAAVVLEGEEMNAMNDDSRVSVMQEKEEKENKHSDCWMYKKRRTIYTSSDMQDGRGH